MKCMYTPIPILLLAATFQPGAQARPLLGRSVTSSPSAAGARTDLPHGVVRAAQDSANGGTDGQRELFQCPPGALFAQPANDCTSWSNAYTSAAGPDVSYTCYDDFWGVSGPICDIHFWGLVLRWNNGWLPGDPNGLVFEIKFYAPGGPPFAELCSYVVQPQSTYRCTFNNAYDFWQFDVPNLTPCCNLGQGWVSIQSLQDPEVDLFLWLDAGPGTAFQHDGVSYNPLDYNLGFCLTGPLPGGGACCLGSQCLPGLTQADCVAQGGVWQGTGSDCFPNPCTPLDYWWDSLTGEQGGTGWNGAWIYYPESPSGPWYNMWWPNEYDLTRRKRITLTFTLDFMPPGELEAAFVWSTPDWQDPTRPPLPNEEPSIERQYIGAFTHPGTYTFTWELPFCPSWVSIDIRGSGYIIQGTIEHICLLPTIGACCYGQQCLMLPELDCLNAGGWYLGDGTDCEWNPCYTPPLVCVDPGLIHKVKCFTPLEWQPKLMDYPSDTNGNFIDDAIDALPPNARVEVLLDVNRCPSDSDLFRFSQYGVIGYRSPFLSVVQLRGVRVVDTPFLALDEAVAMVELNRTVQHQLATSVRAIRVRSSGTYSPNTVEDAYGLTGTGVGVAIVDTGVDDGLHESLPAAKFVGGYNAFSHLAGNPDDDHGHGTHCAGIAIGTGGPSGTYRGVAPGAALIDVKVLDSSGSGTLAGVIEGIDFCIASRSTLHIDVISMSLGAAFPSNGSDATSQAANNAMREGIVTVVAAGNSGPGAMTLIVPGVADDVITVAAAAHNGTVLRTDDTIGSYSSRGPRLDDGDTVADELKPDVTAHGTAITSAMWNTASSYWALTGTSMATPHAAGLAALIRQFVPTMTAASVKDLIKTTAEDFGPAGWDAAWGDGLINGYQAINQLGTTSPVDLKFNDPGCCHSTDLIPLNPMIVEGVPNTIRARVTNGGPTPAFNFKVKIGVYGFSNGQADYQICLVTIPGPLASGATMNVDCGWTPLVSGTPPGVVHACLKAEIIFPYDSNYSNNNAQHNIDIQQSFSPANYRIEVLNPTDCDILVHLEWLMDPPDARWVFQAEPMEFPLAGREAPRTVEMTLNPLDPEPAPVRVVVRAVGMTQGGDLLDLGGGTIFAQHNPITDCNGNGVDDWIDVRTGTSRDDNGDGVPDECNSTKGDLNCDGVVNFDDIVPFVLALSDPAGYAQVYPDCNILNGDCNEDGAVTFDDINCFVAILSGGQ